MNRTENIIKRKVGRPTTYKPEYCQRIIDFFSPPYYIIKDMTITKPDGTQIDKTEKEACEPLFLSSFARSIGIARGYRQIFKDWAEKNPEFSDALNEAKELETQMYRVNGALGLYNPAFSIFTLKNIAGWRDVLIDQSQHLHLTNNINLEEFRKLPIQDKIKDILNRK